MLLMRYSPPLKTDLKANYSQRQLRLQAAAQHFAGLIMGDDRIDGEWKGPAGSWLCARRSSALEHGL